MGRGIGDRLQIELLGVGFAHNDRECIVEPEWFRPFDAELRLVRVLHLLICKAGIIHRRLFQNCRQSGARVFDVRIDLPRRHCLMTYEGPAEVQLAIDGEMRLALDLLRQHLAQNDLLCKILRTDDDSIGART